MGFHALLGCVYCRVLASTWIIKANKKLVARRREAVIGAQKILMPVAARKQLADLPDELATKVTVVYYADAKNALLKSLSE